MVTPVDPLLGGVGCGNKTFELAFLKILRSVRSWMSVKHHGSRGVAHAANFPRGVNIDLVHVQLALRISWQLVTIILVESIVHSPSDRLYLVKTRCY